jgi:hypothetical protein
MIVRLVFWRLGESDTSFEDVRELVEQLEPLETPSAWLWNDSTERFGAVLVTEDEITPPQLDPLRALIGREPDLYEEFDVLAGD